MSEGDRDNGAVVDIDGNLLHDPDNTWEFYGSLETCPKCTQIFKLPSDLLFHEPCYDHPPSEGMIKCPAKGCVVLLPNLKRLRSHHNDCHETIDSFYCSLCTFECCSYDKISSHKLTSHPSSFSAVSANLYNIGPGKSQCMNSKANEKDRDVTERTFEGTPRGLDIDKPMRYQVICGKFRCEDCHESFKTVHRLVLHEPCFSKRGSFMFCPECSVVFRSTSEFKVHLEGCHDVQIYICCRCHTKFKKKHNVEEHVMECNQPIL